MSQDVVADGLNQIMNAKRADKEDVIIKRYSKLLLNVLDIGKKLGYIKEYRIEGAKLIVKIGDLNECRAIKPRFYVGGNEIEKYMRRYLPSRRIGALIISTNQGLMTHHQALEKNIGGSLIAYFF